MNAFDVRIYTIQRRKDRRRPYEVRTARAIDLATGGRCGGPVFLTEDGRRLDRHGAGRIVRKVAHRAGITKNCRLAYAQTRVHHRRYQFGYRRNAARRSGSRLSR